MKDSPRGLGLVTRVYRALLLTYPASWRAEDRDELEAFFRDRYRDAWASGGVWRASVTAMRAFLDAVLVGLSERFETRSANRRAVERQGVTVDARNPSARSRGGDVGEWIHGTIKDLRIAARGLLRTPGFTVVCVLTLALGIGPNAALFTLLRSLVLAPLPYPDAERILAIRRDELVRGLEDYPASPADLVDYRARTDAFAAIAGFTSESPILTEDGLVERLTGIAATPELLQVLGVEPAMGRGFTTEDGLALPEGGDGPAAPEPILISHAFWIRRFGGERDILGRKLAFGSNPAEVIGVMPEGFRVLLSPADGVPAEPDVILPFRMSPSAPFRGGFFLHTLGRLAPGVTHDVAAAQMDAVTAWQRSEFANYEAAGTHARVVPLQEDVSSKVRPILMNLAGAVALVLLIACANVANLFLVRTSTRTQEVALRSALGGGRLRLVRQMLIESTLVAAAGGALGLLLAWASMPLLQQRLPAELPRLASIGLSVPVLVYAVGIVALTTLVFGTLPALEGSRADVMDTLRGRSLGTHQHTRIRAGLVILEVALSFVLVLGAGLMLRSVVALSRVDPGFRTTGVLAFDLSIPPGSSPDEQVLQWERLRAEILSLPGVRAAGSTTGLPLGAGGGAAPYGGEAELADGDESDLRQANIRFVGPGYFETMRTPLIAGRELLATDAFDRVKKVLVDEALAAETWPDESPLGKRIYVKVTVPGIWFEVAGVVGHQRLNGLTGVSRETLYLPSGLFGVGPGSWVARVDGEPASLADPVRDAVARVDERILVENVHPLEELVERAEAPTRAISMLFGGFGAVALALALIGLYGVVSYLVRERRPELGLRVALGADVGRILAMVMRRGLFLAGAGVALGSVGALGLARVAGVARIAGDVLVGVGPTDPLTIASVAALFLLTAAAATWVPARRAVRVDPMVALRAE